MLTFKPCEYLAIVFRSGGPNPKSKIQNPKSTTWFSQVIKGGPQPDSGIIIGIG